MAPRRKRGKGIKQQKVTVQRRKAGGKRGRKPLKRPGKAAKSDGPVTRSSRRKTLLEESIIRSVCGVSSQPGVELSTRTDISTVIRKLDFIKEHVTKVECCLDNLSKRQEYIRDKLEEKLEKEIRNLLPNKGGVEEANGYLDNELLMQKLRELKNMSELDTPNVVETDAGSNKDWVLVSKNNEVEEEPKKEESVFQAQPTRRQEWLPELPPVFDKFIFPVFGSASVSQRNSNTNKPVVSAAAVLSGAYGVTGRVEFTQQSDQCIIEGSIEGLTPGQHGVAIYDVNKSYDGSIVLAGHYNPHKEHHGAPGDDIRHAGDLGNVSVDDSGRVVYRTTDSKFTVNEVVGKAFGVAANPDDLGVTNDDKSQLDGNTGDVVTVGIITAL